MWVKTGVGFVGLIIGLAASIGMAQRLYGLVSLDSRFLSEPKYIPCLEFALSIVGSLCLLSMLVYSMRWFVYELSDRLSSRMSGADVTQNRELQYETRSELGDGGSQYVQPFSRVELDSNDLPPVVII